MKAAAEARQPTVRTWFQGIQAAKYRAQAAAASALSGATASSPLFSGTLNKIVTSRLQRM